MKSLATGGADLVDTLLEASIVGSFSRAGYEIRRRAEHWGPPSRLDGRVVIVTGASSGIGEAAALELASRGAQVWLVGRNAERLRGAALAAEALADAGDVHTARVDLLDAEEIAGFAERVSSRHERVDALVHNAGALFANYGVVPDATGGSVERTMATHVLAPFRLTSLLAARLFSSDRPVIVTVTSGGMYTQRFDPAHIDVAPEDYRGARAYAHAKRAQVVLSHEWARRWREHGVASYAVHPGWVNTPGLVHSLPTFAKLGPLLRTPAQGADTVAWLAADDARHSVPGAPSEGLWHDRRRRGEYYLPFTYRTRAQRESDGRALWDWCAARTGLH